MRNILITLFSLTFGIASSWQGINSTTATKSKMDVTASNVENTKIEFNIDPFKKKCLLKGLDDIAMTLGQLKQISTFENKVKENKPWLNKND